MNTLNSSKPAAERPGSYGELQELLRIYGFLIKVQGDRKSVKVFYRDTSPPTGDPYVYQVPETDTSVFADGIYDDKYVSGIVVDACRAFKRDHLKDFPELASRTML